jgi:hypothetical protein
MGGRRCRDPCRGRALAGLRRGIDRWFFEL